MVTVVRPESEQPIFTPIAPPKFWMLIEPVASKSVRWFLRNLSVRALIEPLAKPGTVTAGSGALAELLALESKVPVMPPESSLKFWTATLAPEPKAGGRNSVAALIEMPFPGPLKASEKLGVLPVAAGICRWKVFQKTSIWFVARVRVFAPLAGISRSKLSMTIGVEVPVVGSVELKTAGSVTEPLKEADENELLL